MSEQSDTQCASETHDPQRDYIRHLEHELEMLTNAGVIECMVRNKSVNERIGDLERDLSAAQAEVEEYRDQGRSLYCTTCGSCGDEGCCPPGKCWKARAEEMRASTLEECAALAELYAAGPFEWMANYPTMSLPEAIRELAVTGG